MPHVVLLGDSIFDNSAYTRGGPDVVTQWQDRPVRSSAEVLWALADASEQFERRYRRAVAAVVQKRVPVALCTIYNGYFPEAAFQRLASTALIVFNDVILRVALEHGFPVIDLRAICNEPADYANPIEPSSIGGAKIARAIVRVLDLFESDIRVSRVVGVNQ